MNDVHVDGVLDGDVPVRVVAAGVVGVAAMSGVAGHHVAVHTTALTPQTPQVGDDGVEGVGDAVAGNVGTGH